MDVAALRRSWDQLAVAGPEAAKYFYATLFLIAPETRAMFPSNMQHQQDKLLSALGYIITHVDDMTELASFAKKLGADHRRFRGQDRAGNTILMAERHYIWVGQALLATFEHFLGPRWTPALRDEWAAAYHAVAQLMMDGAVEAHKVSPPYWECEVLDVERRRADVSVFTVRPNYLCDYQPGQSLPVELPELRTWRYLSPANAPRADGTIEFHARATGRFSTHLVRRLQPGHQLMLGSPVGTGLASYDRAPYRPLLLIAGGTGLAPLRSIAEAVQQGSGRPTTLIFGAATPDDLYDDQQLSKLASLPPAAAWQGSGAAQKWLRYVPTVETGWGWRGEFGRAVDVAVKLGPWPNTEILVCGSSAMVRDSLTTLTNAGVRPAQILTESYDHSIYPPLAATAAWPSHDQ